MKVMFLVNGRWFKTLCKTVLEADTFDVSISNEKHNIHACISDKCYFLSIDNYCLDYDTIDTIKTDFCFKRNYKNIKEFTAKLEDCFSSFINNSITDRHFHGNIDECISKILDEIKETKTETTETETTETTETAESVINHNFTDFEFECFKKHLKVSAPCDFPSDIVLHQTAKDMTDNQKNEYSQILLDKGLAIYHNGEIVTAKSGFHLYTPVPNEPKTNHTYKIHVFKNGAFICTHTFSLESFAHNAFKMIENNAIDFPEHCFTVIELFKDGKPVKRSIINSGEKLV